MIEIKNLTKRYNGFTAVENLSLTIGKGELCAMIGPSGCGKSTTLKVLNRLEEPTEGSVCIDGGVDIMDTDCHAEAGGYRLCYTEYRSVSAHDGRRKYSYCSAAA